MKTLSHTRDNNKMKFKSVFGYLSIALAFTALSSTTTSTAQNLQAASNYSQAHEDLLASQSHIQDQIKVDEVEEFASRLYEGLEPESDIFSICWINDGVDPYAGSGIPIPDKQEIDVSDYHMPCTSNLITSNYGYRRRFGRMHKGVDLRAPIGDTVRAAFDGKIRLTKYERRGYGYYVIMRHENGLETIYGHLSRFLVKPNDYVKAGDPIALSGNTGRSTGPHLHFETRFMGYAINPNAIFDFKNGTTHTDVYTFNKNSYKRSRNYAPASYSSSGKKYHKIRRGDSLSKIAVRYHTTVSKLCALNGISRNATIRAGRSLRVR